VKTGGGGRTGGGSAAKAVPPSATTPNDAKIIRSNTVCLALRR